MKQFAEREWNFSDSARVPDEELLACCYWEYARESAFIRDVVYTFNDVDQRKVSRKPLDAANRDLTWFHSVGTPAHLICHPKFPKPWQSLLKSERAKLASNFKPEFPVPEKIPAFRVTGDYSIASSLFSETKKAHEARQAMWRRLSEVDRGVANLPEASDLRKQLAAPVPPPIVRGVGGLDFFIAEVNWQNFTENEIVDAFKQWVKGKKNRYVPVTTQPKGVRGIKGGRGRDPKEWRASLERLGIMRLMHHHSFDEMTGIVQAALPIKSADREKYSTKAGCKKERQKALDDFHELFPSISDEKQKSWKTPADGW